MADRHLSGEALAVCLSGYNLGDLVAFLVSESVATLKSSFGRPCFCQLVHVYVDRFAIIALIDKVVCLEVVLGGGSGCLYFCLCVAMSCDQLHDADHNHDCHAGANDQEYDPAGVQSADQSLDATFSIALSAFSCYDGCGLPLSCGLRNVLRGSDRSDRLAASFVIFIHV